MAQRMSRARQRAQRRYSRRERKRNSALRLLAVVAGVFSLGLLMGIGGGLYFSGMPEEESGPAVAEADEGRAAAEPEVVSTQGHPALGGSLARYHREQRETATAEAEAAPDGTREAPPWRRHAVAVPEMPADTPKIAIVIDDLGLNRINANAVIDLPPPLTLAFMSYAPSPKGMTERAREAGHELIVHLPMEPSSESLDPGPNALRIADAPEKILERLTWGLTRFGDYVGLNNHMGSAFTEDEESMRLVLRELERRGLLFLDSRTSRHSVAAAVAAKMGVPYAVRDVFLDNERDLDYIRGQLAQLERIALNHGSAIAIGHPHDETIEVLREWIPDARKRGIALVPISALVRNDGEDRPHGRAEGSGRTDRDFVELER